VILLLALLVVLLFGVSGWAAVAVLLVACVLEAGELLFLRRWSRRIDRRQPAKSPDEQLVGLTGEVVTPCRPDGQVRVRGELWAATCEAGADAGTRVRVESVDELTVRVSALT
jgi:membrane protein implicated in regulation of membrane protease activity